jgi:competence protein ComEA
MKLSRDESRALGFVALLLALSAGVRVLDRPRPVRLDATAVDLTALEAASREAKVAAERRPLRAGERIDPNTAPVSELMRLPRVGKALAEQIVADRERAGPFRSRPDLQRVRGVGPATVEAWGEHLALPESAPSPSGVFVPAPVPPAALPGEPARVRLNRATAQELETLPGIGPALAARIVAYRDSAGGFRDLDELERVRGIGAATLAKLKPLLSL